MLVTHPAKARRRHAMGTSNPDPTRRLLSGSGESRMNHPFGANPTSVTL